MTTTDETRPGLPGHPEKLFAEYVDGTLGDSVRVTLDSHIATCPRCRDEVDLAWRARDALAGLPELDVPQGTTDGLVFKGLTRPPRRERFAWTAAFTAAAAVIAALAWIGIRGPASGSDADQRAAAPTLTHAPQESGSASSGKAGTGSSSAGGASGGTTEGAMRLASGSISYTRSNRSYDDSGLQGLARSAADERVPAAGGPSSFDVAWGRHEARAARECVAAGANLDSTREMFALVDARYREIPAFIGEFRESAHQHSSAKVVVYAVAKQGCRFLAYAEQRV